MAQICPSSSHQLVAAAIAFRRARRKFPKNYGLYTNEEEPSKPDKAENASVSEDQNNRRNLLLPSTKSTIKRPSHACTTTAWNDERGENTSVNLLQKPIICSCCRKRNEAAKLNEPINSFKSRDESSAGDTLQIVSSREYNRLATSIQKSDQQEKCDAKVCKSSETETKDFSRSHILCSYPRKQSSQETSKLDSVNLLYDRAHGKTDNVKYCSSLEERNCNTEEECNCDSRKKDCKLSRSRSKLDSFSSQRDRSLLNTPCTCDFHCTKHPSLNLLQSHQNCHRAQNRHCSHNHRDCCHHQCCDEEFCSCSSNEKPCLASDTCLRSPDSANNRRNSSNNTHVTCNSACSRNCCAKNSDKISTVPEQHDEEYDDCVGMINHKDSLCILVEKYKTTKKCKHKKYFDEPDLSDERAKDECNKSFTSEVTCQPDTNENVNSKKQDKILERYQQARETRGPMGKICRHGCGRVFRESDSSYVKNLKSRLIKSGTCCSPKGTPWRHTF